MDGEVVNEIARLAVKASENDVRFARPPGEPAGVYFSIVREGDGVRLEKHLAEQQPATPDAKNLDSLIRWTLEGQDPEFWYNDEGVWGYRDRANRRSYIELLFTKTKQYEAVLKLVGDKKQGMDQKEFLRYLRIDLHGVVENDVVQTIRNVSFKQQAEQESRVAVHKASLGTKIEKLLDSEKAMPEMLYLYFPIFKEVPINESVKALLDVDLEGSKFVLTPVELDDAVKKVFVYVRDALEQSKLDVPVFFGRPSDA